MLSLHLRAPCLLLLLLLLGAAGVRMAGADNGAIKKPYVDILEPPTLADDMGNKADASSDIDFTESSTDKASYKAGKTEDPVTVSMAAWFYDMSSSIARSSLPGAFPFGKTVYVRLCWFYLTSNVKQ